MIACPSRDALQCIADSHYIEMLGGEYDVGYSRIGDQLRSTVETFCACTALPIAAFLTTVRFSGTQAHIFPMRLALISCG